MNEAERDDTIRWLQLTHGTVFYRLTKATLAYISCINTAPNIPVIIRITSNQDKNPSSNQLSGRMASEWDGAVNLP